MAGLENIKSYMIGIVVFIVIITSGVFIIGTFSVSDPTLDNHNDIGQFNNTLNKANEITLTVNSMDQSIKDVSEENTGGLLGWLNVLVGTAFKGLKAIGSSLGFVSTAATESASFFGVPTFIVTLCLLIITIIIVFAIWSAIMRVL